MSCDVAISVRGLGKAYPIFANPKDRLKQLMFGRLRKDHQQFWALQDLSFEVRKGQIVGVIGRNGSGKSTLLQLVAGIVTPTCGEVEVRGRIAALLELGAGFNPEFSGRENVYLNGAVLGMSRSEIDGRFEEIAGFAEIGPFMDQPVKTYSSGMFVRLAFAVQACVDPEIMIVDEALAVGDVFFRQKCYRRLRQLQERGTTILLVTHAMADVEEFCDWALVLHQGKLQFVGSAQEAVKRYYLIEQKERMGDVSLAENAKSSEDRDYSEDLEWPTDGFVELGTASVVSNGGAECVEVAITDEENLARRHFYQGQILRISHAYRLAYDIEVPIGGVVLQSDRGVIVHGKHVLQYENPTPKYVRTGEIVRYSQTFRLDIAPGEYTIEVGLASIPLLEFNRLSSYTHEEFDACITRLIHLPRIASINIQIGPRGPRGQLPFYGLTDLPGSCAVQLIMGDDPE